jgi:outer membrane protein assembly factor BamB
MRGSVLVPGMAVVLVMTHAEVQAQRGARLQEVDPQARTRWSATLPISPEDAYTVIGDQVAALTRDGRSIRFYAATGDVVREAALPFPAADLAAAPSGTNLLATDSPSEDHHTFVILGSGGETLWSATLDSTLSFTPSGRFLVADFDALDSSQPPTAYRVESGEVVWTDSNRPYYWQAAAAQNDTLVYYRRGAIALIDLESGATLWEKSVPVDAVHGFPRVWISRNGKLVVLQALQSVETEETALTQAYDERGQLLWEKRVRSEPGTRKGATVRALSEDGALLALADAGDLALARASDGTEVARVVGRGVRSIVAFTRELAALKQASGTRLLRMAPTGAVVDDLALAESITVYRRAGETRRDLPILVERTGQGLRLSEVRLDVAGATSRERK